MQWSSGSGSCTTIILCCYCPIVCSVCYSTVCTKLSESHHDTWAVKRDEDDVIKIKRSMIVLSISYFNACSTSYIFKTPTAYIAEQPKTDSACFNLRLKCITSSDSSALDPFTALRSQQEVQRASIGVRIMVQTPVVQPSPHNRVLGFKTRYRLRYLRSK